MFTCGRMINPGLWRTIPATFIPLIFVVWKAFVSINFDPERQSSVCKFVNVLSGFVTNIIIPIKES